LLAGLGGGFLQGRHDILICTKRKLLYQSQCPAL
jgi:hypothetical protein